MSIRSVNANNSRETNCSTFRHKTNSGSCKKQLRSAPPLTSGQQCFADCRPNQHSAWRRRWRQQFWSPNQSCMHHHHSESTNCTIHPGGKRLIMLVSASVKVTSKIIWKVSFWALTRPLYQAEQLELASTFLGPVSAHSCSHLAPKHKSDFLF